MVTSSIEMDAVWRTDREYRIALAPVEYCKLISGVADKQSPAVTAQV